MGGCTMEGPSRGRNGIYRGTETVGGLLMQHNREESEGPNKKEN